MMRLADADRLVGEHGQLRARGVQPVERFAHAGIEHRVIERMVAVVIEEELERALDFFFGGLRTHGALDQHGRAIADEGKDLFVRAAVRGPTAARVAFTAWARSRRESIRVPSRSKISSGIASGRFARRARTVFAPGARETGLRRGRLPSILYSHHFPLQRVAMNAEQLRGFGLIAVRRVESTRSIMPFSRISTACFEEESGVHQMVDQSVETFFHVCLRSLVIARRGVLSEQRFDLRVLFRKLDFSSIGAIATNEARGFQTGAIRECSTADATRFSSRPAGRTP